jgi:SAM-dependent methyltransferase
LSEDPVHNQDLLKDLYLQIIPSEVRHDLGEYYTPDWVADLVFSRVAFEGRSDQRVLDPACGSGTFLTLAISKIKQYYQFNREAMEFDEAELLRRILTNVVGFDINPLAVLASRTNYLIAIREFLPFSDRVELPVYLCDSVVTPAEYGDLFTGAAATARVPCAATRPPFLLVPKEVGEDASTIALYAGTIEHCMRVRFSPDEFIEECRQRDIQVVDPELHKNLYQTLLDLQAENKNGIWARIIKNSFAPLFAGKFDLIVGNPPWINWENLPPEYREMSAGIWEHYKLTGNIPGQRRQVSKYSKTDAAILMTYVAADKYAKEGALLGLVLPRTIFQSELGGWHFRKFELPDGRPLAIASVDDIDRLRPFSGQATNMSCVAAFTFGGEPTRYPVPWNRWEPTRQVRPDTPYPVVLQVVRIRPIHAQPIDVDQRQSPWVVGDEACLRVLRSLATPTVYAAVAREGMNTRGANGIFFVDASFHNGQIFITNRKSDGRNDSVDEITQSIEPDFLYPLLRGENVGRFIAEPEHFVLVPHHSHDPVDPAPFRNLPERTREFLADPAQ